METRTDARSATSAKGCTAWIACRERPKGGVLNALHAVGQNILMVSSAPQQLTALDTWKQKSTQSILTVNCQTWKPVKYSSDVVSSCMEIRLMQLVYTVTHKRRNELVPSA